MTKKQTTKKVGKKAKVLKVQITEPVIDPGTFIYKTPPIEPTPPPAPPKPAPAPPVNPNEPVMVHITEGFKRPSITNVLPAYTYEQYERLIENYKRENPAKYELKRSELDAKLEALKR